MASTQSQETLLNEQELRRIERAHPEGLTSAQIIQIFQARGARLSEATFRKYVQLRLLPRSRRVGTKGKHRGSHGIYPCATVRRVNSIKAMMATGHTIEEIQRNFSDFKSQIDRIDGLLDDLFKGFSQQIAQPRFDRGKSRKMGRELDEAKRAAGELLRRVSQLEINLTWPAPGRSAAAGALRETQ